MTHRTRIALLLTLTALVAACTTNQYFVVLGSKKAAVQQLANESRETVIVYFDDRLCPTGVGVVDPDCPNGLGGDETACRQPGDGTKARLKVVRWKQDANAPPNTDFSIAFRGLDPCVNNPASPKVCVIKNTGDLPWNSSDLLITKYAVTRPGCEALDPYIIVTR